MKRILIATLLLLAFCGSSWALTITTTTGSYEAGAVDHLYSPTAMKYFVGSFADEVAWVQSILGDVTMLEADKETVSSSSWGYGYDGETKVWGFNFDEPYDYFLIKTGKQCLGGNNHFLFTNSDDLYWAVLNLSEIGVNIENIGKISHIDPAGGEAPVPEPATLLLIGSGLLAIAGFRKKMS